MSKPRRKSLNQRIRDTMQRMHTQVWEAKDLIAAYGPHPYTGKVFNSIVHTLLRAELERGNLVREYDPTTEIYGYRLTTPPVCRPDDFFDVAQQRKLHPYRRRIAACIRKPAFYHRQGATMEWALERVERLLHIGPEIARPILEVELPKLNRQIALLIGLEYSDDGSWEYPTPESLAEMTRQYRAAHGLDPDPEDKVNFF